jgi:hypothetical protein
MAGKSRVRMAATAAIFVVAVGLLPSSAAADGHIEFAASAPLTVSAGASSVVQICAVGTKTVPVTFAVDGLPMSSIDVEGVSGPAPRAVPAGACTQIKVSASSAAKGSGTLVAASDGSVARRAITVAKAGSDSAPVAPLEAVSLSARHYPFGLGGSSLVVKDIPFGPYKVGQSLDVSAIDAPAGTVAVLQSGSSRAYLVRDGSAQPADARGIAELPVRLEGAASTGAYTGSASFTDADGKTAHIKLTVSVGDPIWACIGVILLGIFITALATLLSQRTWPSISLYRFRNGLEDRYRDAVDAFNKQTASLNAPKPSAADDTAEPGRRGSEEPTLKLLVLEVDSDAIDLYSRQLKQAYERYVRQHPLVDPDSSDYTALQSLIEKAKDDVDYLADPHGLRKALTDLRDALVDFDQSESAEDKSPKLADGARNLFVDGAVGVGDATTRGADAAAFTSLLQQWPALLKRLNTLESWAQELRERADNRDWPHRQIERADATLARVRVALFDTQSPSDFAAQKVIGLLDDAEAFLIDAEKYFRPRLERVAQTKAAAAAVEAESLVAYSASRTRLSLSFQATRLALPMRGVVEQAKQLVRSPAVEKSVTALAYGTVGVAGYTLVTLLAVGAAVAASLTTVYSPTFGSLGDYLTVLGIGGASAVASKALIDAIANMRRAPR